MFPSKILIFIAVLFIIFYFLVTRTKQTNLTQVKIGNITIAVEIADSPQKREKGLSDRASLASNHGMLFVFPENGRFSFWMKGMSFPLDFIWINDNRIVEITEAVKPPQGNLKENLPVLTPQEDINMVLEVNSGFVRQKNLKIGDRLEIQK